MSIGSMRPGRRGKTRRRPLERSRWTSTGSVGNLKLVQVVHGSLNSSISRPRLVKLPNPILKRQHDPAPRDNDSCGGGGW